MRLAWRFAVLIETTDRWCLKQLHRSTVLCIYLSTPCRRRPLARHLLPNRCWRYQVVFTRSHRTPYTSRRPVSTVVAHVDNHTYQYRHPAQRALQIAYRRAACTIVTIRAFTRSRYWSRAGERGLHARFRKVGTNNCEREGVWHRSSQRSALTDVFSGRQDMYVVLDADGLWMIGQDLSLIKGYRKAVLTPNVMEFKRLSDNAVGVHFSFSSLQVSQIHSTRRA